MINSLSHISILSCWEIYQNYNDEVESRKEKGSSLNHFHCDEGIQRKRARMKNVWCTVKSPEALTLTKSMQQGVDRPTSFGLHLF